MIKPGEDSTIPALEKISAVFACLRGETTPQEVAARLNVSANDVIKWEETFLRAGYTAFEADTTPETDLSSELFSINAVNQTLIAILDLDELLQSVPDLLRSAFGYATSISTVDGTDIVIHAGYDLAGRKLSPRRTRFPITTPNAIAQAALNRHLIWRNSELQQADLLLDQESRSVLALPIVYKETALGVLETRGRVPHAFSPRDINLLTTIIYPLAVAMENARLFKQVYRRLSQLELLQSVAARALEDTDVHALLNFTAQMVRRIMGYPLVAVGLTAANQQHVEMTIIHNQSSGDAETRTERLQVSERTVLGAAITRAAMIAVPDLTAAQPYSLLSIHNRCALAVPISTQAAPMGVLYVESNHPYAFDDGDISTIRTLADHLAVAIRSTNLMRQAQTQLLEIRLFRRLADEANVAIFTRGTNETIDYANRAAAQLYGFPSGEKMRGIPISALYNSGAGLDADRQICMRAMNEGGWNGEITHTRQDKQTFVANMAVFPIFAPDGSFITFAVLVQDASTQRNALQEIARVSARFEAVLQATTDGFIIWDDQWRAILANPAAARILNLSAQELSGLRREDTQRFPALKAILDAPENQRLQLPNGGNRMVRFHHKPWHMDETNGHLTVIYDETDQVAMEKAHDDTINMLIHDLRSPLNIVTTGLEAAEIAMKESTDPAQALRFIGMAMRGAKRVFEVTDALLDMSKLESGSMTLDCQPLNIAQVFDEIAADMGQAAKMAGIELRCRVAPDAPKIDADKGLMRRAIVNLVDNALKFSPPESAITVTAEFGGEVGLKITVADQGPGVPESYRKLIFEKYAQGPATAGIKRGKGLGLAFCRLVAEAHRGSIWVETRPEGGSLFTMTLRGCESIPKTLNEK